MCPDAGVPCWGWPGRLGPLTTPRRCPGRDEDKRSSEKKREEKAKKKHDRKARRDEDEDEDAEGGEWEKVKGGVPMSKVLWDN